MLHVDRVSDLVQVTVSIINHEDLGAKRKGKKKTVEERERGEDILLLEIFSRIQSSEMRDLEGSLYSYHSEITVQVN